MTYLLSVAANVYAILCLLRFLVQATHVDFYNPHVAGLLRVTKPVLQPLRSFMPANSRIDTASITVAWLLFSVDPILGSFGQIELLRLLLTSLLGALFSLIKASAWIVVVALVVSAVSSFVAPQSRLPALLVMRQMTEEILRPVRRFVPPLGGLDFSPAIVLILIFFVLNSVLPTLSAFVLTL